MTALEARLSEARKRLHDALLAGQDTAAHRAAIAKIERDLSAAAEKADQARSEDATRQAAIIAERSDTIRAASSQRITALIDRFPIPTRTTL